MHSCSSIMLLLLAARLLRLSRCHAPRYPVAVEAAPVQLSVSHHSGPAAHGGLELTLTSSWAAGPAQGTTRLVASANRNRLQGDEYAVGTGHFSQTDGQPSGARQDGLNADGSLRYVGGASGTSYYGPNVSSGGSAPVLAGRDQGATLVLRTWLLGVRAAL